MTAACLLFLGAVVWQQCSPAQTPPPAASAPAATTAPPANPDDILSVKELMEFFVDPVADYIFDAAVVDVSTKGTVATQPVSDDDWLKIERGAWQLAESSHLLKMPRRVAPVGAERKNEPGKPAPELSTAEIEAMINADRALWNKHADGLRVAALEALQLVRTRDVDAIFKAGDVVNKACEACHLEYWYPGDKPIVEADARKKVTFDPPKKP
jgi:hypothetical protein